MLIDTQKQQYETLGFLALRDFIEPAEMRAYTDVCDKTLKKATHPVRWKTISLRDVGVIGVGRFFDYNRLIYHRLLDDDELCEVIEDLLGEDFVFTVSEGTMRFADTRWHHDDVAPEDHTHMKAVF